VSRAVLRINRLEQAVAADRGPMTACDVMQPDEWPRRLNEVGSMVDRTLA
jgi:hypothetical protein